jgi:uncharacterized protein (DUF305 family)
LSLREKSNSAVDAVDAALAETMNAMREVFLDGKADADFARMMIPHHQGAIEMAKVELQFGVRPFLRRLAQEIIVTQQSEIDVMNLALKKYPLSFPAPYWETGLGLVNPSLRIERKLTRSCSC